MIILSTLKKANTIIIHTWSIMMILSKNSIEFFIIAFNIAGVLLIYNYWIYKILTQVQCETVDLCKCEIAQLVQNFQKSQPALSFLDPNTFVSPGLQHWK